MNLRERAEKIEHRYPVALSGEQRKAFIEFVESEIREAVDAGMIQQMNVDIAYKNREVAKAFNEGWTACREAAANECENSESFEGRELAIRIRALKPEEQK